MINTYKSPKLTLAEDEVFVFGSNPQGFSGAGSAGWASFNEHGNVWRKHNYQDWPNGTKGKWNVKGVGEGPALGTEGKSYAIPTVDKAGAKRSRPLDTIKKSIDKFYAFAKSRPHLKFFVAQENKTSLNGYTQEEMASIYSGDIPENVYFDEGFAKLLTFKDQCPSCKTGQLKELSINDNWEGKLTCDLCGQRFLEKEIAPIAPESRQGLKTIVAGSRSITDYELVSAAIKESNFEISEIVSGTAKGVDSLGERWAEENNIPVKRFPAPWDDVKNKPENEIGQNSFGKKYWKRAGAFRNQQMADYVDALIAITNGSSGTADMIERAKKKGLTIFIKELE